MVVFFRRGNRSSKTLSFLKEQGFKHVINGGGWHNVKKVKEESDKQ